MMSIKWYFILSFNILNTYVFFLIVLVSKRHMLNSMWFQFNDFFKVLSVFALFALYQLKLTFRIPDKEIILLSCNDIQKAYCFKNFYPAFMSLSLFAASWVIFLVSNSSLQILSVLNQHFNPSITFFISLVVDILLSPVSGLQMRSPMFIRFIFPL